jgi:hypothetical protein
LGRKVTALSDLTGAEVPEDELGRQMGVDSNECSPLFTISRRLGT